MPFASGLYYHVYQSGEMETPPVVLLHGAGGTHLDWPPGIRRLSGFRVFSLDLPGHGKSEGGGGQQSITAYSERVLEWMSAVGFHQAVFVGHSMGGAIALELAVHRPEQVLGLGLFATGGRLPIPLELLSDAENGTTFYKVIDWLVSKSFGPLAPADLVKLTTLQLDQARPGVLYGDLIACAGFDCTDALSGIRLPTLVLCGSEDKLTPVRYAQLLADVIPTARLEVIARAGHMVMLEQPQAVALALASFLEQIDFLPGGEKSRVYRN